MNRPAVERALTLAGATVLWLAATAVGALLGGSQGALGGGVVGLAAAALVYVSHQRADERRRALLAAPFPESWRSFLLERCDAYARLPADPRARFERGVRLFLGDKRISGVEVEVGDEERLLVAASAVTLSLSWPDYGWPQVSEVLLYPQDFDRDYSFERAELAGQAHGWGTLILSVPTLHESFQVADDAYHVGYHEFAHLLDLAQTQFDGIPAGMPEERAREWLDVVEKEMDRLRRGKSVIDPYGAEDPVEFWPVSVEAFFEVPQALRRRHREVYALLCEYFGQDPAAWDDARGLRE